MLWIIFKVHQDIEAALLYASIYFPSLSIHFDWHTTTSTTVQSWWDCHLLNWRYLFQNFSGLDGVHDQDLRIIASFGLTSTVKILDIGRLQIRRSRGASDPGVEGTGKAPVKDISIRNWKVFCENPFSSLHHLHTRCANFEIWMSTNLPMYHSFPCFLRFATVRYQNWGVQPSKKPLLIRNSPSGKDADQANVRALVQHLELMGLLCISPNHPAWFLW